jgi:hypothetical protein
MTDDPKQPPQDSMVSSIIKAMEEDSKKFGGVLIKAATESFDKERTNALVQRVRELVKHRMALYAAIEKTKIEIALFDRRLAAIDAGEFFIENYSGQISFKDQTLNY